MARAARPCSRSCQNARPVSATELARATGIARAAITSSLCRLVADGTLERVELPAGTHGYRRLLAELVGANGQTSADGRPR